MRSLMATHRPHLLNYVGLLLALALTGGRLSTGRLGPLLGAFLLDGLAWLFCVSRQCALLSDW